MRVILAAVGRLKDGPDRKMFQTYAERFDAFGRTHALGPLAVNELPESRARDVTTRKDDEAERLIKSIDGADMLIAMDERAKTMTSAVFANLLRRSRDDGIRSLAFAIGGPDGHGPKLLNQARMKLSLGPMTLPHGLARIVLTEQLYRAATIIDGHPYHRE